MSAQGLMQGRNPGTSVDSELPIVTRIAAGDQHALVELYRRYQRQLYSYLRLLTRDDQLAEEVLQDTLLAVWTGAHRFRAQSTVRTWLYGIARRQAHNAVRRPRSPLQGESAYLSFHSSEPRPDETALINEELEHLVEAIQQLSPVLSETLMLVVVHDMSYMEAGVVLGIPIGTVKSRLSKARNKLRPLLESAGGDQQ